MKLSIQQFVFAAALITGISACKKDETQAVLDTSSSNITLSATNNNLILLQDNAADPAVTFDWNAANFGFKAAVTYTLQFAKKGADFAGAADVIVGNSLSQSFTVATINQKLLEIVPYEVESEVEVRVKAEVGVSAPVLYSNVITLKVTPYRSLINYVFPKALHVAGNYQEWNPGTAPKIVDKNAEGQTGSNYEGYINFTDGAPHEFKLVKGDNWNAGDFGSPGPGLLSNGGNNLSIPTEAGVYLVKANTVDLTWSYTLIKKWAITGSATPLGWATAPDGTPDQDHTMTFDPNTGLYTITINLVAGKLKFRANDAWALNFGDGKQADNILPDGIPDYSGDDIDISSAGNYTITLDIMVAGNYAYTIKKN